MKVEKKSELIGRGGVYRRPVIVSQETRCHVALSEKR
jgi:hypothetical protein